MTPTYSISVRIRRTVAEYTYVRVPVTSDVMQTDAAGNVLTDAAGAASLDGQKVFDQAIALAKQAPATSWNREAEQIEPHPIQKALDPGEASAP